LRFPMFAEQLTERQTSLSESETRYYTDSEIELLIDELTEAALEAINQAAGEAARAAFLSSLEREAEVLRENQQLRVETEMLRKAGFRNCVISGIVCFAGGLIAGLMILN